MKKTLSILLAIFMLLSLAACGEERNIGMKEKEKTTDTPTTNSPIIEPTAPYTEPVSEGDITANDSLVNKKVKVEFGTLTDEYYDSETIRVRVDYPEDWFIRGIAETAYLNGISADELRDNLDEFAQDNQVTYLFYAANEQTGDSINIVLENLELSGSGGMTSKEYVDAVVGLLEDEYEKMDGVEDFTINTTEYYDENGDYYGISVSADITGGNKLDQDVICIPVNNRYISCVTVTAVNEKEENSLLKYVHTL